MMAPSTVVGLPLGVAGESSCSRMTALAPVVELRTRVQTLQLCAKATYDAAFPMEIANNLVIAEERLRALPACLQAVVTEAIRQGAATVLAAT
jgi:hypothetical protein